MNCCSISRSKWLIYWNRGGVDIFSSYARMVQGSEWEEAANIRSVGHWPPLVLTHWRKHLEAIAVTTRRHKNQDRGWSSWTLLLVQSCGWLRRRVANAGSPVSSASFSGKWLKCNLFKKIVITLQPLTILVSYLRSVVGVNIKDFIYVVH